MLDDMSQTLEAHMKACTGLNSEMNEALIKDIANLKITSQNIHISGVKE